MKSILLGISLFMISAAALAQVYVPSNISSDLERMTAQQIQAVQKSPAIAGYAMERGLGSVTDVTYKYSGFFKSGIFLVSTSRDCTFEAKVRIHAFSTKVSPVVDSEECH